LDGWGETLAYIFQNNLLSAVGNIVVFLGMCYININAVANKDSILGLAISRLPVAQCYDYAWKWIVYGAIACLIEGVWCLIFLDKRSHDTGKPDLGKNKKYRGK
jgi:hypothetical protein